MYADVNVSLLSRSPPRSIFPLPSSIDLQPIQTNGGGHAQVGSLRHNKGTDSRPISFVNIFCGAIVQLWYRHYVDILKCQCYIFQMWLLYPHVISVRSM